MNAHKTIAITMTTTYSILHILFLGISLFKKFYFILFPLVPSVDRSVSVCCACLCVRERRSYIMNVYCRRHRPRRRYCRCCRWSYAAVSLDSFFFVVVVVVVVFISFHLALTACRFYDRTPKHRLAQIDGNWFIFRVTRQMLRKVLKSFIRRTKFARVIYCTQ